MARGWDTMGGGWDTGCRMRHWVEHGTLHVGWDTG